MYRLISARCSILARIGHAVRGGQVALADRLRAAARRLFLRIRTMCAAPSTVTPLATVPVLEPIATPSPPMNRAAWRDAIRGSLASPECAGDGAWFYAVIAPRVFLFGQTAARRAADRRAGLVAPAPAAHPDCL